MDRPSAGAGGPAPEAVGRFVEHLALLFTDAGFPRMPARVFAGLLVADARGYTAKELAETLRISPAAVSGAVRYLTQVGLAARAREPGERRDRYRVLDDLWYTTVVRRDAMFARWEAGLREGVAVLGAHSPAGVRLEETRQFFAFLRAEFPALLARWREQQRRPVSGGEP